MSNIIKIRKAGTGEDPDLSITEVGAHDLGDAGCFVSLEELRLDRGATAEDVGPDPHQLLLEEQDRVRAETEKMVRDAEAGVAEIEEQAREKGFSRGKEEGLAAGQAEFTAQTARVLELLAAIEQERLVLHKRYEKELLPLVKAMCKRLLNQEILTNPQVIAAALHEAMDYMVENSRVTVHLNPDDYANLNAVGLDAFPVRRKQLTLIADERVAMGGCFLDTDFGEIDATVEVRLEKLYAAVDQAFPAALEQEKEGGDEDMAGPEEETSERWEGEGNLEPERE